jgi:ligand-binding sensor domain-containing protein
MRLFLWLGLFLLLPGAILGVVPSTIAPSHSLDTWDTARGFPGGYVYSVTQTVDGYLWIGTSKGLLRYDGLSFVTIEQYPNTETKVPIPIFSATLPACSKDHYRTTASTEFESGCSAKLATGGCSSLPNYRG